MERTIRKTPKGMKMHELFKEHTVIGHGCVMGYERVVWLRGRESWAGIRFWRSFDA